MESDLMVIRQSPRAPSAPFFTALLGIVLHSQAAVAQFQFYPPPVSVESLLQSPGPKWEQRRSAHFVLYTEHGISFPLAPEMLRDSLEEAWRHDTSLLDATGIDQFPVTVL